MTPKALNERKIMEKERNYEILVAPQAGPRKYEIIYFNVLQHIFIVSFGLYGLYQAVTYAKRPTILFNCVLYVAALMGVTVGAHRLWCHRAYKAKLPLQVILMLFHCLAYQNAAARWARDHRMHHKYSDTDADPHNATRGLFYSHLGWLLVKKHPEMIKRGNTIDCSDIYDNPVLKFQLKYYLPLVAVITFIMPTAVPMYFWDESFGTAFAVGIFRLGLVLNITFLVNSAAHRFGNKPYDKSITPTQSIPLSLATLGECFHNFHHVFPFDYRTSELGNNYLNFGTNFINFFAWIGWAYDLKTVSNDMIVNRAKRTGDGTDLWGNTEKDFKNPVFAVAQPGINDDKYHTEEPTVWGWENETATEGF